eukprot:9485035-Pyramimonas_sp.AAC.1
MMNHVPRRFLSASRGFVGASRWPQGACWGPLGPETSKYRFAVLLWAPSWGALGHAWAVWGASWAVSGPPSGPRG